MERAIYFDMDGTIANLYTIEHWRERIERCDSNIFKEAEPMNELDRICELCSELQHKHQFKIGIVSWCSKTGTAEFDDEVRKVKQEWLSEHFRCRIDECHIIKYGTRKDTVVKNKTGILIDDNAIVRNDWKGRSIDPNEIKISEYLQDLLRACEIENDLYYNS